MVLRPNCRMAGSASETAAIKAISPELKLAIAAVFWACFYNQVGTGCELAEP